MEQFARLKIDTRGKLRLTVLRSGGKWLLRAKRTILFYLIEL